MLDFFHSWTFCRSFFSQKLYESAFSDLWITSVLFDLDYKFSNDSFALLSNIFNKAFVHGRVQKAIKTKQKTNEERKKNNLFVRCC